jgi:hypothetical protein
MASPSPTLSTSTTPTVTSILTTTTPMTTTLIKTSTTTTTPTMANQRRSHWNRDDFDVLLNLLERSPPIRISDWELIATQYNTSAQHSK